jgi:hypothetical protein
VLAAAEAGKLALADASGSPRIADGLRPLSADEFARVVMRHHQPAEDEAAATGTHA